MAREALSDDTVVARIAQEFVPVLVDVDAEKQWAEQRNVSSIPVIHWTDSRGEVFATTEDLQPAARVLEDMDITLEFLSGAIDEE